MSWAGDMERERDRQAEALRPTVRVDAAKLDALREAVEKLDALERDGRFQTWELDVAARGVAEVARELLR